MWQEFHANDRLIDYQVDLANSLFKELCIHTQYLNPARKFNHSIPKTLHCASCASEVKSQDSRDTKHMLQFSLSSEGNFNLSCPTDRLIAVLMEWKSQIRSDKTTNLPKNTKEDVQSSLHLKLWFLQSTEVIYCKNCNSLITIQKSAFMKIDCFLPLSSFSFVFFFLRILGIIFSTFMASWKMYGFSVNHWQSKV